MGGLLTAVSLVIIEWPGLPFSRSNVYADGLSFGDAAFVAFGVFVIWSVMVILAGFLYLFSEWYVGHGQPLVEPDERSR